MFCYALVHKKNNTNKYRELNFHDFDKLMNKMKFTRYVCKSKEFVYFRQIEARGVKSNFILMIYTSIDTRTLKSRSSGKDSIRFLVRPMAGNKHTAINYGRVNRTEGALDRVLLKARKIFVEIMNNP